MLKGFVYKPLHLSLAWQSTSTAVASQHMENDVMDGKRVCDPGAQLCGGPAMGLLRPEELEQLVCGRTELDFAALQEAARYDSGFTADTPVRCLLD